MKNDIYRARAVQQRAEFARHVPLSRARSAADEVGVREAILRVRAAEQGGGVGGEQGHWAGSKKSEVRSLVR